ncbi:MAG: hypothetical protein Q7K57_25085 [Burkholderiaceae bacterium]|nr:hypothetical protein [Burkholderiaceae bacterium]
MKLKKYVYEGPDSGITVLIAAAVAATATAPEVPAKFLDVVLRHGEEAELPPENDAVKTLEAKGFLKAVNESGNEAILAAAAVTDASAVKAGKK